MPTPIAGLIPVVLQIHPQRELVSAKSAPPPTPADGQEPVTNFDIILRKESTGPEQGAKPSEARKESGDGSFKLWEKEEFGLDDILDLLNPLQHLPVISTLYRSFSGDQIGALPRLLGGALYGRASGIPGVVSSVVNSIIGIATGKDIGEHLFALFFGGPNGSGGQGTLLARPLTGEPPPAGADGASPQASPTLPSQSALVAPGEAKGGAADRAGARGGNGTVTRAEDLAELLRQARLSGPYGAFAERAHALRSYYGIAALYREKPEKSDFLR